MAAALKDLTTVELYEDVFERYMEVCNKAIEKNKDKSPYREIWKARWEKLGPANTFHGAIYDDEPKLFYALRLTKDMKIKIMDETPITLKDVWPFKYSYLKHVVNNPQQYIERPANLDWGWLTDVFG